MCMSQGGILSTHSSYDAIISTRDILIMDASLIDTSLVRLYANEC